MPDRESAITHLQIISTWASFARERDLQFFTAKHLEDIERWAKDAIALLKEQEPIKPKSKVRHGENGQIQHWCGNCMAMLHGKPKYCSNCGRQVKWE